MMKRFLFAVAVAALSASAGFAADPPVTTAPPPTTATPVIVGAPGTPVITSAPATPARRGLFARLRNRNATTYSTAPVMTAPPTFTPAPAPVPMPGTIVPAPMPPQPGGTSYFMPSRNGTIILTGGPMPDGTMMTTQYTEPARRRGLFGRMRDRNTTYTSTSAPMMTAPIMPAPALMPMPGSTVVSTPTPGSTSYYPPPNGGIIQAGGLPPGTYTATDGSIITIGATSSAEMQPISQPTTQRRGLFGRLRNR